MTAAPHKLTAAARERAARALAEACNGGAWARDYTDAQRDLWRRRVDTALQQEPDR